MPDLTSASNAERQPHVTKTRQGKWSWVSSAEERDLRIQDARRIEGLKIGRVRYFDLDYYALHHPEVPAGPRAIDDPAEWKNPSWKFSTFDRVDFFVEIETSDERKFAIGWGDPDLEEGLWIREVPDAERFLTWTPVALWDVTSSTRWSRLVGKEIDSAELRYRPTTEPVGYAGDLLTLRSGDELVQIFLGDVGDEEIMRPSIMNLLVISPPTALPNWLEE
jgi:hypothetical protein